MDLIIRKVDQNDTQVVKDFFSKQVRNTFHDNNIFGEEGIVSEIECKHEMLHKAISISYPNDVMFMAISDNNIAGVGGCSTPNSLITDCDKDANIDIGSVYVDKAYRRKGVASSIINTICDVLRSRGETHFFLDSGYKTAQAIWQNKFGEPTYILENYWDTGCHHMVWKIGL